MNQSNTHIRKVVENKIDQLLQENFTNDEIKRYHDLGDSGQIYDPWFELISRFLIKAMIDQQWSGGDC